MQFSHRVCVNGFALSEEAIVGSSIIWLRADKT